jgi:hypothetical protein
MLIKKKTILPNDTEMLLFRSFEIRQEPILRLMNLQLQRQHCSMLERFFKIEEIFLFVFKT